MHDFYFFDRVAAFSKPYCSSKAGNHSQVYQKKYICIGKSP
jgi:hypothetical protein